LQLDTAILPLVEKTLLENSGIISSKSWGWGEGAKLEPIYSNQVKMTVVTKK